MLPQAHLVGREKEDEENTYEGDDEHVVGDYEDDNEDLQARPHVDNDGVPDVTPEGEERVNGLVIHHVLTAHRAQESDRWLRHNIFYTTCTSGGKQCTIIIDSGSTKNLV